MLAEELGHYFNSSVNLTSEYITYFDKLNRSKQYKISKIYAYNCLIIRY